jgi:hypothetical protein
MVATYTYSPGRHTQENGILYFAFVYNGFHETVRYRPLVVSSLLMLFTGKTIEDNQLTSISR